MAAQTSPVDLQDRATIEQLERLIARDVGREIAPLAREASGGLLGAAEALAGHPSPRVVITTGMFIPDAEPPAAETDGPLGSIELARGLQRAGACVRLLTDELCAGALTAALHASANGHAALALDVLPVDADGHLEDLLARYRADGTTHFISVERIGPARDGRCYDMRGNDITDCNGPIDAIYSAGPWTRVGIGDGGNEIGMGALPVELVASTVDHGDRIACVVPCEHLIVCGVSNWGAQALLIAVAVLLRADLKQVLEELTPSRDSTLLKHIVERGPAVDGVIGREAVSVDGLEATVHSEMLEAMLAVAGARGRIGGT